MNFFKKKAVVRPATFASAFFFILFAFLSCSHEIPITNETPDITTEEKLPDSLPVFSPDDIFDTYLPSDVPQTPAESYLFADLEKEKIRLLLDRAKKCNMHDNSGQRLSEEFISSAAELFGADTVVKVVEKAEAGEYTAEAWHDVTGNTIHVIRDMAGDKYDKRNIVKESFSDEIIRLGFGGDFAFYNDSIITWQYLYRNKGAEGLFSKDVLSMMRGMDVMLLNCEYSISDTGTPMAGKKYTFRSSVKHTRVYGEMGVDIVSLANNHVYDYGKEAFLSTLKALDDHNVYRIGAGKDLDEAREVQYFTMNGRKIAYVAATRAEKTILTPGAGENSPGVFRAYDSKLLNETIKKAKAQSDIVILYIHWGAENENRIEDIIKKQGKEYIDSGADVIIGAHAHQLQGIEFYKGKMIAYNLGNYLFNGYRIDTGLMEVCIDEDGNIENYFHPFIQHDSFVSRADETEGKRILDYVESISVNVTFDEKGRVMEK